MKKLLIVLCISCLSLGFVLAQESNQDIVSWLYANGLTKYSSTKEFRPYDSITRGEAAKFMAQYLKSQNAIKISPSSSCQFDDITNYDSSLTPHILDVCEYGVIRGYDGKFHPNKNITKGEAITIVMRVKYGLLDETLNPWYLSYYNKAQDLGINLSDISGFNNPVNRIDLGSWIKDISLGDNQVLTLLNTSYSTIKVPVSNQEIKSYTKDTIGILPYQSSRSAYMYQIDVIPKRSIENIITSLSDDSTKFSIQRITFNNLNGVQRNEGGMGYEGKVEVSGNKANYVFTIFAHSNGGFEEGNENQAYSEFYNTMRGFTEQ